MFINIKITKKSALGKPRKIYGASPLLFKKNF